MHARSHARTHASTHARTFFSRCTRVCGVSQWCSRDKEYQAHVHVCVYNVGMCKCVYNVGRCKCACIHTCAECQSLPYDRILCMFPPICYTTVHFSSSCCSGVHVSKVASARELVRVCCSAQAGPMWQCTSAPDIGQQWRMSCLDRLVRRAWLARGFEGLGLTMWEEQEPESEANGHRKEGVWKDAFQVVACQRRCLPV